VSLFIEVMAWIVIAYAAVPTVLTLLDLAAGLYAGKQRHGRAKTLGDAWPDLRAFLPCAPIGVSLLGHQLSTDTAGWWLTQIPLLATTILYLSAWIRPRLAGRPGTPAADREIRTYLVAFAATTSLLTYEWQAGTAGWWLMHIPVFAASVVCLEAAIRYLTRRKSDRPTAEPS